MCRSNNHNKHALAAPDNFTGVVIWYYVCGCVRNNFPIYDAVLDLHHYYKYDAWIYGHILPGQHSQESAAKGL
jgi:hypothetical protein